MKVAIALLLVLTGIAFADATLDAKHGAALHRALAKHPDAQRLLVPATCTRDAPTLYTCVKRGCAKACLVIEARAKVRLRRGGVLTVHAVEVEQLGDTGQCGHCMSTE